VYHCEAVHVELNPGEVAKVDVSFCEIEKAVLVRPGFRREAGVPALEESQGRIEREVSYAPA
jgi:hypothetical protein